MTTRRGLLRAAGAAAVTTAGTSVPAGALARPETLVERVRSPTFLVNGVATDAAGTMFLSMPRWTGMDDSPGAARLAAHGAIVPFPGGAWHAWRTGPASDRLLQVNAVRVCDDGLVWIVDQGAPDRKNVLPGGQKLLAFRPDGALVHRLAFDPRLLPEGAAMNDLRKRGSCVYVTDSGLGGILLHDLDSGLSLRRLSEHPDLRAQAERPQKGTGGRVLQDGQGRRPQVHSDMIELAPDGRWLYWSTPSGPLRRIETALLWDTRLTDADLAERIETVARLPSIGGTAIDSLGNLYFSDVEARRIAVLTPDGSVLTLVQDDRLVSPDALWIDSARRLLVPAPQTERLPEHADGVGAPAPPFSVYSFRLPRSLQGWPLGVAVSKPGRGAFLGPRRGI